MIGKLYFRLVHKTARDRAIEAIRNAPDGWIVVVQEPTRTLEQNSLLHGLLQELDGKEWFGKPRSMLEWKVLTVSGHAIATGIGADVVPGLEGELVNLRESTAKMTVSRLSSLVEYIKAWMATHGAE
jgi:hypothetical protein